MCWHGACHTGPLPPFMAKLVTALLASLKPNSKTPIPGDAKCDGCDACDRAEVAAAASASGVTTSNEVPTA